MKITKKQWIVGGAVALVLAGGGAGVVANHQSQVHAQKVAQQAKDKHDKLVKVATEATQKAETFKAEVDVKSAQDAIKNLDEKDKSSLITRVEKVRQNWDLVNKADKAVMNAEKTANDANVKTAQTAIDTLKADMTKAKKKALQTRLDKVKTTVKNNKAKAKAKAEQEKAKKQASEQKKAAQASATPSTPSTEVTTPTQDEQSNCQQTTPSNNGATSNNVEPTPQTPTGGGTSNGGSSNNNVTPSPAPTPTPDPTPQPDPTPTPTPTETFTGWVRRGNGTIVWSQGGFKTLDEAAIAAIHWLNSQDVSQFWDGDNSPTTGAY